MKFPASLTILVATLSVSALAWSDAHADPSPREPARSTSDSARPGAAALTTADAAREYSTIAKPNSIYYSIIGMGTEPRPALTSAPERSNENQRRDDSGDMDDTQGCALEEECKTPCEELEEAMEEATGEAPYGAVGCHNGEVLICVYPENFTHDHDDETGAAIAESCIQAHEDAHGGQCECDADGEGLQAPENDLESDENEGAALSDEIDCYEASDCSESDDPDACQEVVDEFKAEACEQYESTTGEAHGSC